jgi:hypothetical protein
MLQKELQTVRTMPVLDVSGVKGLCHDELWSENGEEKGPHI